MPPVSTISELHITLAETIAWCRLRVSEADPSNCLRTSTLQPSNLHSTADPYVNFDYDWGTTGENVAVVSDLALKRAELLRAENAYTNSLPPALAGGRLLIAKPEESDHCCLSEAETEGFIDALDVPAWDTWVCYVQEPTTPEPEQVRRQQEAYRAYYNKERREGFKDWQPPTSVSYILCWIPPQFVAMVEEGIEVNPVQCLFWAKDYRRHHHNTELLRRLNVDGLLK